MAPIKSPQKTSPMDLPRDLKAGPRAPALRCSRLCSCDLYNKWPRRAAPASPRRIHSRIKFSVPWNILKPMHIYIYAYIIDIYIHAHTYIYDSVVLYFNTLVSAKLYILSYTLQSMTLNKGARRALFVYWSLTCCNNYDNVHNSNNAFKLWSWIVRYLHTLVFHVFVSVSAPHVKAIVSTVHS
jgi:hypothetical protein